MLKFKYPRSNQPFSPHVSPGAIVVFVLVMLVIFLSAALIFLNARQNEYEEALKKQISRIAKTDSLEITKGSIFEDESDSKNKLQSLRKKVSQLIISPDVCLVLTDRLGRIDNQGCHPSKSSYVSIPFKGPDNNLLTIRIYYEDRFSVLAMMMAHRHESTVLVSFVFICTGLIILLFTKYLKGRLRAASLFERDTAIGVTAQMLAHDIKKPLNMLQQGLSIMEKGDSIEKIKETAQMTLPAVHRAKAQIDNMLTDLREISSKDPAIQSDFSLYELFRTSIIDTGSLFDDIDVEIDFQLNHHHQCYGDFDRLLRVVGNILVNAIQAMLLEGKIRVKTEELPKAMTQVTIGNSGPLISASNINGVFDEFYSEGKKNGSGLGLAIVKKIVQVHGGTVKCRSDELVGTEFEFTLKRSHALETVDRYLPPRIRANNNQLAIGPSDESGVKKVLVVDDDAFFRDSVSHLFKQSLQGEVQIHSARTGQEALTLFHTVKPDLVWLDIDLGPYSCDGHDLLKLIKSQSVSTVVCMSTGSNDEDLKRKSLRLGANFHFCKPALAGQVNQSLAILFDLTAGRARI